MNLEDFLCFQCFFIARRKFYVITIQVKIFLQKIKNSLHISGNINSLLFWVSIGVSIGSILCSLSWCTCVRFACVGVVSRLWERLRVRIIGLAHISRPCRLKSLKTAPSLVSSTPICQVGLNGTYIYRSTVIFITFNRTACHKLRLRVFGSKDNEWLFCMDLLPKLSTCINRTSCSILLLCPTREVFDLLK